MRSAIACVLILLVGWSFWMFGSSKSESYYPRVQLWIDAASCAKTTGHYLVVCDQAGLNEKPIEDVSLADDRGHTLILTAITRLFNIEPSISVLRAINLTINLLGFALFTLILNYKFGWRSAVFTALLGAYWIGGRAGPDVDAAYIGISLLTLAAIFISLRERVSFVMIGFVFLLLSFVVLIRQPIGLGAALSVIIGAAFTVQKKNWLRPALIIVVALASTKMATVPTAIRNLTSGIKPTGTAAHGFSHNLFLGLGGYVDNKWGIVWDDNYAKELVHKTHPEIQYCSDQYFDEIGRIYCSYVMGDPKEAARVYLKKAGRVLSASGSMTLPSFVSLLFLTALIFFARRKRPASSIDRKAALIVGTMAVFGFSFLAQGVLTHPAWTYVHPGPVIFMICVAMAADRLYPWRQLNQPTTSRTA